MSETFKLVVSKDGRDADSTLCGIVGRPSKVSDADTLSFEFPDRNSAKKALERIKKKGLKAVVEQE